MKTLIICILLAVFGCFSCEYNKEQSLSGEENITDVDDVIVNEEKREVDPFIQSLQGTWRTESYISYDKEWKEIEEILIGEGAPKLEGGGLRRYIFNVDGSLTHARYIMPNGWTDQWTYPCYYNEEQKTITVKNEEGEKFDFLISDYDGEQLVLDYTIHSYNDCTDTHKFYYLRETLKRSQE